MHLAVPQTPSVSSPLLAIPSYSDSDADLCSKRNAIRERRARVAEKARLEEMAARMSAKKLQRLRKVGRLFLRFSPSANERDVAIIPLEIVPCDAHSWLLFSASSICS